MQVAAMKLITTPCRVLLCAGALALMIPAAEANMLVYPMAASIGPDGNSAAQLRVYSKSEQTQYVKATVQRVVDPATDHEREESDAVSGEYPVVVSPAKFVLPAGGARLIRIIPLSTPEKEVLYRVYLQPVAPPSGEDVAADSATAGQINFNLVWAPLVRVLPKHPAPDLQVSEGVVINTGNVRIGLLDAGGCPTARDESACNWKTFERSVYPDQKFKLDGLSPARYVRIRYRVEGMPDVQQKVVPAHPADAMDSHSALNLTIPGQPVVSISQKD